ncbi:hypothetical protein, partial [uncultured Kingella sp.]|uniref:hypothetical protein n=1 Tax=uncultured Kingella sp. TaxID=159270 RepID=UPI002593469E
MDGVGIRICHQGDADFCVSRSQTARIIRVFRLPEMGFSGKLREILAAGLGWRKFKDIKDGQPENAQHLFRL